MSYLHDLKMLARERDVPVHMDGARIFNAAAALGVDAWVLAAEVDSVQFCLSKGLGAPVGSLVAGPAEYIENARRQRKLLGGAMRQSGVIAAAGLVALETMRDRLPDDHRRAQRLAAALAAIPGVGIDRETMQSNIVLFHPPAGQDQAAVVVALAERGLKVSNYGDRGLRMVTHHQVDDAMIDRACEILGTVLKWNPVSVSA